MSVRHLCRRFSPLSLAPALWLDATVAASMWTSTAESTQSTDGASVGRWKDQSGNGRHCDQATAGSKPTLRTSGISSRPAVEFDGTDDRLATASFTLAQPCTIALVAYSNGGNGYYIDGNTGDTRVLYHVDGTNFTVYSGANLSQSVADQTTPRAYLGTLNGASSVARSNASRSIGSAGTNAETGGLSIGSYGPATVGFCNGRISEIVVVARALTQAEEDLLIAYLRSKWSV